jgi:transcriptional regulator with XRE-family HTH domain
LIKRRFTATVEGVTTAFADEAVLVHEAGRLTDRQIARATGAAPSTVRSWLSGRSAPTGERAERVAELSALVSRLTRVVDADYIPVWMTKPVEALDDEKPIDLLARGEYRRVAAVVRALEHPGAA